MVAVGSAGPRGLGSAPAAVSRARGASRECPGYLMQGRRGQCFLHVWIVHPAGSLETLAPAGSESRLLRAAARSRSHYPQTFRASFELLLELPRLGGSRVILASAHPRLPWQLSNGFAEVGSGCRNASARERCERDLEGRVWSSPEAQASH